MERISEKGLQAQLERTAKALGVPVNHWERIDGHNVAVVGALVLSREFHGWQLHRISNAQGGVHVLFGHRNLGGWDMLAALRGMEEAAEIVRESLVLA